MTDNHQATAVFAELARDAVDRYLDALVGKLESLAAEYPGQTSCFKNIRRLLTDDLRPAFIHDLAELLEYGSGARIASRDALERFLTLFDRQLDHVAAAHHRASESDQAADNETTRSCFEHCRQSARGLAKQFPDNYQAIVAVEARRLAGVSLVPQPAAPEGRLFSGAPHDSLWPSRHRVRIVDEHSVSAPTYRWGSRGYR